jgi:hypothetical protein
MNKFFDSENFNKIHDIIFENIKQHKSFNNNYTFLEKLNQCMISIYNGLPNQDLIILNKQVLLKIIPEIINDLNKLTESQVAYNIEEHINNELIPNIEMNMQPEYMSLESRKMYQETSTLPLNDRNLKDINTSNIEPKDLYKENKDNKVVLKEKQEKELNSNNELLEITSEIYNKTSKAMNYTHDFIFTIDTMNRDLVNQNDGETVNTNYTTNSTIIIKFNQKSTGVLSDIHISGTSFKNIITLELINITIPKTFVNSSTDMKDTYGVKENNPIIIVQSEINGTTAWRVHPYLLLEIEQISSNMFGTPINGKFFCKLYNPSNNCTNMNLKIIGGKKIFRRTELLELKQMNINILDSRGNKCFLGYGPSDIVATGIVNPTNIGTDTTIRRNITMDFKVSRLEADLENYDISLN